MADSLPLSFFPPFLPFYSLISLSCFPLFFPTKIKRVQGSSCYVSCFWFLGFHSAFLFFSLNTYFWGVHHIYFPFPVTVRIKFSYCLFVSYSVLLFSLLLASMFCVRVSTVSLLQAIGARCQLPYVSLIHRIYDDGTVLYGVEMELPALGGRSVPRKLFFWSELQLDPASAYDHAALQVVCCLQSIYGFVILDYSFDRLVSYATAGQGSMYVRGDAIRLANMLVSHRHGSSIVSSEVLPDVQRLLSACPFVHCSI